MDDVIAHLERSDADLAVANVLSQTVGVGDWEIVVRFYSALHLTTAYLATKNKRFEAKRHDERWRAIKASPELAKANRFPPAYKRLQDMSEQVRYDPGFKAREKDFENVREDLKLVQNIVRAKVDRAVSNGSN